MILALLAQNAPNYNTGPGRFGYGWMMNPGYFNNNGFGLVSILGLTTWVLTILVLIALIRWLWIKGDNENNHRTSGRKS